MADEKENATKGKAATDTRVEENADRVEKMRNTDAEIGAASSDDIEASGAIMEPSVKSGIDVDHVSVDNNPRAGTSQLQNNIDFNDPTANDAELVAERTKSEVSDDDAVRNPEDAKAIPRR